MMMLPLPPAAAPAAQEVEGALAAAGLLLEHGRSSGAGHALQHEAAALLLPLPLLLLQQQL
jgi:hypothetical protein